METRNAIEHGRRPPQVRTLDKLVRALGVEAKDLFA
jgi:transcriptional regulator with XRE-family HTH domain